MKESSGVDLTLINDVKSLMQDAGSKWPAAQVTLNSNQLWRKSAALQMFAQQKPCSIIQIPCAYIWEYIEMGAQEQKAGNSTVLLIAVIKQKRRRRDFSETWALTPNALFYNHDDESVGKTSLSFAVALARFSHTETPPLTQIHIETENEWCLYMWACKL